MPLKNTAMYSEADFLSLSGIQHFAFCRRQWALIHVEQQWQENLRTMEGQFLHEKAHERGAEKRGDVITTRAMPVFSASLGARGVCDVVEFHSSPAGVPLAGRDGLYLPMPVEYKRGKPKEDDCDTLQLCAQAICLAEMLVCDVPEGCLYYGETRHRLVAVFDDALRARVRALYAEMHELMRRGHTPKVKPSRACRACSLADICMPKLCKNPSARAYIQKSLAEEVPGCENF